MSYAATISDPNQPDAMPMWESFDHASAAGAYAAAQTHIHATEPGDRVVDEGDGVYFIWAADPNARPAHVATLVIAPTDELDPPASPTDSAESA
jgi:hypothetical protein